MQRDKHKRKINHVLIVTSDAVDTRARQFKFGPKILWTLIIILCLLLGALLGYLFYEENIWQAFDARHDEQVANIKALEERITELESEKKAMQDEKLSLETEIAGLNENILIMSETINEKTKSEAELTEQLTKQSLPTEFPLNSSATMDEGESDNNPICIFTASEGTIIIATARGTVTAVNDDVEYGHNVWVDHKNGYVTVYRNGGEARVKVGDTVVNGTPLFVIESGQEKLGYQMMKDGEYISPMEMLAISG